MDRFLDGRLEVLTGDITALKVDAVVNAANSGLMGGGGVDGAIHRRGGPQILAECKELRRTAYPDGLPPGEAVMTSAGNLPCSKVIHTVGPVWRGGGHGEDDTLARAYAASLGIAAEQGFDSAAFPAISTGVYGFPKDRAAVIAFGTVRDFLKTRDRPSRVLFVFYAQADMDAFLRAVKDAGLVP